MRKFVLMLIAYGDDSADETKGRVFAAGAVVGRQEDWDAFIPEWLNLNPRERPFHATDCDADQGDFRNRKHWENKALYADNVRLFAKSNLIGAGVAISIPDYWDLFPFAPDDEFWPYYMCFVGVLACLCGVAKLIDQPDERVKVLFDNDPAKELDSARLYDFAAKIPGALQAKCLKDRIEFGNHREDAGLQVADLIARETMKDLDNRIGPKFRWPRQSLIALKQSNRFATVCYDRAKLEEYRVNADRIHADPQKGELYNAWLESQAGIRDSIHARLRFMTERGIIGS